jgi:hypothetical protein
MLEGAEINSARQELSLDGHIINLVKNPARPAVPAS